MHVLGRMRATPPTSVVMRHACATGLLALLLFAGARLAAEDQKDEANSQLAKMGRDVVKRATKDLKSKDPEKRKEAARSLGGWGDTAEGTALLIQFLADPDQRVRAQAARSLADNGKKSEPARAALQRALEDPFPQVVAQAAEALERGLGVPEKDLVPARLRVLDSNDPSDRFLAARSLIGQAPALKLVDPILDYMEDQLGGSPDDEFQARDARSHNLEIGQQALVELVKRSKDRALIAPLTEAVRGFRGHNELPLKALALFEPLPKGWADLLVEQLGSRDSRVLREALFLMGRTAKSAAEVARWAPEAARLERSRDGDVRHALIYALGEAGGLASDQIDVPVRALGLEREAANRRAAAVAIGEIGDKSQATPAAGKRLVAERARAELQKAADSDPDAEVREKAKDALGRLQTGGGAAPAAPRSRATNAADPEPPAARAGTPASAQSEAQAMATLRKRGERFEQDAFFGALGDHDAELIQAYLDAGMSAREPLNGEAPLRFMLRGQACSPDERPTTANLKALVRLLLARGADPNHVDEHGNTALMEAAGNGCDRELIGILLKAGAKIGLKNSAGLTAFEFGLHSGHDGLLELIAAGYRLPADKAQVYREGYAKNPRSLEMIRKATAAR